MQVSLRFFFRNVQVKGLENIPARGPLLFVSNHPNTILDPIVIGRFINRKVFFLAKGSLFRSKFTKWLLPKFSMIPVYRVQDDPLLMQHNDEMFSKCFEHLKNQGAILIFPEGISLTNRQLRKIKTGSARIALGAEATNNFKLGVKIVSIGLNYFDPHRFQSDLFINIDEPITVEDYETLYKQDEFAAVNKLTDEIRTRLEKQIIAIEDAEIDQLVKNIEVVYKSQLLKDLGYTPKIKEHDFLVIKAINKEVHYYWEHQPERVVRFKKEIDRYFRLLGRLALDDRILKKFSRKSSILGDTLKDSVYMLPGFPVFIFGFVNNYLPYRLPGIITKRAGASRDYHGSLFMLIGTLTFILFYALQITLVQYFLQHILLTICYAIALPVTGFFAWFYWNRYTTLRRRWTVFSLFYRKTAFINSILNTRQHIIDELEKGRKEYARVHG